VIRRRRRHGLSRAWLAFAATAVFTLASPHSSAATPKREVPDYDGNGGEPTTPGDVALWVPRILLSPIYLTTEFLIRRPLGALISGAERAHLPEAIYDFFSFGPDHKAGFAPLVFVDFGFSPSVGVYTFWDDAFFKGNDLRFHGSLWTSEWLAGSFTERIHVSKSETLSLHVTAIRRPDHAFFGTGPRSLQSNISRYAEDMIDAGGLYDVQLWRASRLQAGVAMRTASFFPGHFGGDPSLNAQVNAGVFPLPDGFARGYTAETNHLLAALDTRQRRPAPGSGVRVEAEAEQGNDVRHSPGSGWLRYGGTAGAFYDLNGNSRVVSVSVATLFADPLGREPIPFPELVALGGSGPMRGFFPGRLYDRSALVATAHYRWPIWVWLDGSLQAAVGNVFGEHLQDFKPSLLRFSGAIGIESVGSPDSSFELLFGVGSETFEHGGQIDSLRIAVGTNRGF
jgi:hypothetical protein